MNDLEKLIQKIDELVTEFKQKDAKELVARLQAFLQAEETSSDERYYAHNLINALQGRMIK